MQKAKSCPSCQQATIKNGRANNGSQRYLCKTCKKSFQATYQYQAYVVSNHFLQNLLVEGMGIRSMARVLLISQTTVLKKIKTIAKNISKPIICLGKEYEVDEM